MVRKSHSMWDIRFSCSRCYRGDHSSCVGCDCRGCDG